jgi:hypothetical protein
MSENEEKSPFGPGFVGACIVIGAVLVCGVVLLVSGRTADHASGGTTYSSTTGSSAGASGTDSDSGSSSGSGSGSSGSGSGEKVAVPAGTQAGMGSGAGSGASGCGLPAGDQAVPSQAPVTGGWEISRRVAVPRSDAYGPAKTDADGFRRCFAHSPTGALFAAYNAVAALADQRQAIPTVQKLMIPGANTDALIQELRKESPSTDSSATQTAGFRILDADQDRATIMLAVPVESAYMSLTLTLVWHAGDWRVQPPLPGNPVGAPFSQHSDLDDFVAWSGV